MLAAAMLAGCGSRGIQNEAAVRQGVIDYLSHVANMKVEAMQVDVTSVSFREDEADATVSIRPKGASGDAIPMRYTLERQGDKWVVKGKGRAGAGQSPHGQMPAGMPGAPHGQMPAGMPGAGHGKMPPGMPGSAPAAGAPGGSALPPGHPPIGNAPGAR
jgi:hypothetical protein